LSTLPKASFINIHSQLNRLLYQSRLTATQPVDGRAWSNQERAHRKLIKIKGFPQPSKVKLFRAAVATHHTD
jgi:hypothetical protein